MHNRLTRNIKLLVSEDYQFVFAAAKRFGNRAFTVLARENGLQHARLGLAISKKCAKKAVDRNRIKRIFRESFRLNQHELPAVDIVAMCKPDAVKLDKEEILRQIELQWQFINKKFKTPQASAQLYQHGQQQYKPPQLNKKQPD